MNEQEEQVRVGVLRRYPRAVAHMLSQVHARRFGLVLGAGLSQSLGVPTWTRLVKNISRDPEIRCGAMVDRLLKKHASLPYITEMLFQHYKKKRTPKNSSQDIFRENEFRITYLWRRIIRRHIYADVPKGLTRKSLEKHKYLLPLLDIIRKTKITVTYNFDDLLEQALALTRTTQQRESSRGYKAVTSGASQFPATDDPVVYHFNGIVPFSPLEVPSDRFVFSEHAYADQLLDLFAGDHTWLANHLAQNTCLFVGISFADQSLRNVLRQVARANPGTYHYSIQLVRKNPIPEHEAEAISKTNFNTYNLITLFLRENEIAALAEILNLADPRQLHDLAAPHQIRVKYTFYLTGALGVGKSTAIGQFSNLVTFDEWMEPRPKVLAKPWTKLSPDERTRADQWIDEQFRYKNNNVRRREAGVFVLDRGPLDPLAFAHKKDWGQRARRFLETVCPKGDDIRVEPGVVILLRDDPKELEIRMRLTDRTGYTKQRLSEMESVLREVYGPSDIIELNTAGLKAVEVASQLAEIIHLRDSKAIDLHQKLLNICGGER